MTASSIVRRYTRPPWKGAPERAPGRRARRALALERRTGQCRARLAELPAREAGILWLRYGERLYPAAPPGERWGVLGGRPRRALALEQRIDQCRAMLAELPAREAGILWPRYGEGLPWAQVARRAHDSGQHCKKIHKAALERRAEMRPLAMLQWAGERPGKGPGGGRMEGRRRAW